MSTFTRGIIAGASVAGIGVVAASSLPLGIMAAAVFVLAVILGLSVGQRRWIRQRRNRRLTRGA